MIVDECAKNISSEDNTNANFIKSLAFALAMSFHSVLEGFALGVQEDTTGAVTLFFSLLVDNALDAFTGTYFGFFKNVINLFSWTSSQPIKLQEIFIIGSHSH